MVMYLRMIWSHINNAKESETFSTSPTFNLFGEFISSQSSFRVGYEET